MLSFVFRKILNKKWMAISLLIGNGLSQTAAYVIIYAILTVTAAVSIFVIRRIRRSWAETEDDHV